MDYGIRIDNYRPTDDTVEIVVLVGDVERCVFRAPARLVRGRIDDLMEAAPGLLRYGNLKFPHVREFLEAADIKILYAGTGEHPPAPPRRYH